MRHLRLTLPTPAENLALDEALLDWAEAENPNWEFVRLWESPEPIVVVGRSSHVHREVDETSCRHRGIPILRRSSGGATIVAGPGCLMYAVVLSYELRPELRDIGRAHRFVLGRLSAALRKIDLPACHAGTSDLALSERGQNMAASRSALHSDPPRQPFATIPELPEPELDPHGLRHAGARKFSGNSLRAKRTHFLYHGTLLYGFDLSLISDCLKTAPRQPEYRAARSHDEFVTNLPTSKESLEQAVLEAWPTSSELAEWPRARVDALVAERFSQSSWNYEFA